MTPTHRLLTTLTLVLALMVVGSPAPLHADIGKPNQQMPDLRQYKAGSERKIAFFNLMIPLIEQANNAIESDRDWLLQMNISRRWDSASRQQLASLCTRYDLSCSSEKDVDWSTLLQRVDTVPIQLVLIQAVEESGWGTSRFAREGNNLFGMRCFGNSCGLEHAGNGNGFQSFDSLQEGIAAYMRNLNTHQAYQGMRQRRAALREQGKNVNALALIPALERYSTRGQDYLAALQSLLSTNASLIEEVRVQENDGPA